KNQYIRFLFIVNTNLQKPKGLFMLTVAKTQGTFHAYRCKNPRDFSCLLLQKPKGLFVLTVAKTQGTFLNREIFPPKKHCMHGKNTVFIP
ncbi:MAG: hypothetical protein IKZ10_05545, partial [Akkermansia sp.]|nr:hypothetical protein [Akkermansia sp.]